ncbi:unnamed protein product [Spirodela intermedia]|uniref:RING-type domain-containing protein n=1 Tax=Spirodela intermedia TaxID=51605 RepID=A0A7I8JQH4_SPIIN|nr:unnamed protein product [Spirodela intermedia]CAA6672427.1 unnamed protein product [Spirodela intermedia]
MGIYSLPSPSEGVLTLLIVNTAVSISVFKEIVRFLLDVVGLYRSPSAESDHNPGALPCPARDSLADRFRSRVKPVRFGSSYRPDDPSGHPQDCRVCLSRFELDSVVNRLSCGHLFHQGCLDRWLDYHHATCPLCRTHLLPLDEDPPLPRC